MKKLIRRLSRVADSSDYALLRSDPQPRFKLRFRSTAVPVGHIPVYVGDEMERFVVSAKLVNHPIFAELLNRSAQEYGYQQKGVLRIHCHVVFFEKVLEAVRVGDSSVLDLLSAF